MKFIKSKLKGAYIIDIEKLTDKRGFFARSYSLSDFTKHRLETNIVQTNISFNKYKGTLRGMHFQKAPWGQAKLIRCTAGEVYDVIVDLRPDSPTFKKYEGVKLTASNYRMIYVPIGFAHGFLTLTANCEVFYQMSADYKPKFAFGVRFNDPAFGIKWPEKIRVINQRDKNYSDFNLI